MKLLDKSEFSNLEIVNAMLDLAGLKAKEIYIDMGSGDGRMVKEAKQRGAEASGYEIDPQLAKQSQEEGLNVFNQDCFEADVSQADVMTCWFTKLPETLSFMDKMYSEMKKGARLVMRGFTPHDWRPTIVKIVDGQKLCLFIK